MNPEMSNISAVIITYNEELFIGRCLVSLDGVADEIIVVDSYSSDSTENICKKFNVRFIQHPFEGYRDQKNFAVSKASYKRILSLDADEALSDELRESIIAVKNNWEYDGYVFNRRNNYCGKWIRFSEWYPDRQLRLFSSDKGRWGELNLHERFILNNGCRTKRLKGDLLHWPFVSHEDHVEKMEKYSEIGAREYHRTGRKSGILTPYIHMLWGFIRTYIIKGGFLDGANGFRICSIYSMSSFRKYKKLRNLNKLTDTH
jgi:glycosyltransferase involved in cell wall biosynthesis